MQFAPVTWQAVGISVFGIAAFVAVLFASSLVVPGPEYEVTARGGERIRYRLNGLALLALTIAAAALVQWRGPGLALLARYVWSLFIAANLLAWPAAVLLVSRATTPPERGVADYFYGVERNPQLFGIDLKMFSYRPSLIGLALVNASFAAWQWRVAGTLSLAMICYQVFTLLYIVNYFQFEHGMLFTWDIIEENFGWMLIWGDYVLVPFFYALPAAFVLSRPGDVTPATAAALAALYLLGFWIFRGANTQKHRFKREPGAPVWGRSPDVIGGKLLASGFWGIGRKLNYTGEFLMYLSWTLLAGLQSFVPYLLLLWLLLLLMQRAGRDDRRCRQKYGHLWDEYCRKARFRMFPYIY
jgi:Delta14-sterol reductase